MNFYKKIYYNDKPLILIADREALFEAMPSAEAYECLEGATEANFATALQKLDKQETAGVIIEDAIPGALDECLHKLYKPLVAGGGVVYNEQRSILMIYRRGKWDLPKGKLDEGEDIAACALREVREETGLQHLQLNGKLCDTYHIYMQYGDLLLKQTAWYKMKGTVADKLMPQKEENIVEARWVSEKELGPLAARTYEAVRDVLKQTGLKW